MGIINEYKIRKLERRVERWKQEGKRLVVELTTAHNQANYLSKWCINNLEELRIGDKTNGKD